MRIISSFGGKDSKKVSERLSDRMRKYVIIVSGVCAAAFLCGIGAGYMRFRSSEKELKVGENIEVEAKEESEVIKEIDYYQVRAKENYIIVYQFYKDDTKDVILMSEMNMSVLPKEDLSMLKTGINFPEKEEALMMMENFVS